MSLINELIKGLLPEQEKKKVVAVYGGGFKPPTKGHFAVIKQALKENPEIDEFIVFIGGKERNGISPDESILIWDIYKQYLPFKVEVKYTSTPPIKSVYNYAKDHPDEEVLFINKIKNSNFYYDSNNLQNVLVMKSVVFNIPYKLFILSLIHI